MTDYVLEILDGDRAGEIIELGAEPVSFGRRAGNTVVLSDEKVSGKHATVDLEDGQWVLKDLGSTNGSLIDGRRVEEIGLTANDIFQLGRVLIAFKQAGAPTPQIGGELAVRTVDSARLLKTKRGGGTTVLLALVLVLGAGAAYWFLGGGDAQVGGGRDQTRPPLTVVGNLLAECGNLEAEADEAATPGEAGEPGGASGWNCAASGLEFARDTGRGAHTGRGYLSVLGSAAEGGAHHALCRSTGDYVVSAGSGLTATAYLKTSGTAKASLRLRFWSASAAGLPVVLFTGTVPAGYDGYESVQLTVGVPSGCDRVAVEILALLPGENTEVAVDDVVLVEGRGEAHNFTTSVGQRVAGSGTAIALLGADSIVLASLQPIVEDPGLQELQQAGLLCLSDAGGELTVADAGGAIEVRVGGVPAGLRLTFDAGVVAAGVLVHRGGADSESSEFERCDAEFSRSDVDSLLLGYATSRMLLRLPSAGAMTGVVAADRFVLELKEATSLALVYEFKQQRDQARRLLDDAEARFLAAEYAAVIDRLDQVLRRYPHDDRQQRAAEGLRAKVEELQKTRLAELEAELDNAVYFESLGGYRRIRAQLRDLVDSFGESHLLQPRKVAAMRQRVAQTITRIEAVEGAATREKLTLLASVYQRGDKPELVALIKKYIEDCLPAATAGAEEHK